MISENKNFIFIHVPKTGGNSIQNILAAYADDKIVINNKLQDGKERFELENDNLDIHKHSTLGAYKNQLDSTYYKKLFKFSVIRNPYERLVSHYFSPHREVSEWNKEDFKKLIDEVKPLSHYITTKQNGLTTIFSKSKSVDAELDFLIRFENLEDDFKFVCEKLEIEVQGFPHRNKSKRKNYKEYYDAELIELVKKKFKQEIEFGDYQF